MKLPNDVENSLREALTTYYATESIRSIANRVGVGHRDARTVADKMRACGELESGRKQLPPTPCYTCGCDAKHAGLGMCQTHYDRHRSSVGTGRVCGKPGCDRPHKARDLCNLHYNQEYRYDEITRKRREKTPRNTDLSSED